MTRHFDVAPVPRPARDGVRRVMGWVLLALAPGVVAQTLVFGAGVALQIALACTFALAVEAFALTLRARSLAPDLTDLSALVTAVLFALCIPPLSPWWVTAVGMLAAIGVAKHAYGGLGANLFNPAMVGVAVVVVCFPFDLSHWPAPATAQHASIAFGEVLHAIVFGAPPSSTGWDAIAQATPLDAMRDLSAQRWTQQEIARDATFGAIGSRGWEWIAAAFALGGAVLLWRRLIAWQVPFALLATVFLVTLPPWLWDPDRYPTPLHHLFSGGLMLAAFFVATDPVTGCATRRGRWLFGAGVAALTLAIRTWGSYPDGVAFAVLLMNGAAPLIDRHTRPRFHGESVR